MINSDAQRAPNSGWPGCSDLVLLPGTCWQPEKEDTELLSKTTEELMSMPLAGTTLILKGPQLQGDVLGFPCLRKLCGVVDVEPCWEASRHTR